MYLQGFWKDNLKGAILRRIKDYIIYFLADLRENMYLNGFCKDNLKGAIL